jgi:hypothetical protein
MINNNPRYYLANLSSQVFECLEIETFKTCVNIMEITDDIYSMISYACCFFIDSKIFQKYLFFYPALYLLLLPREKPRRTRDEKGGIKKSKRKVRRFTYIYS